MSKRRCNGEGSVFKRKNGTWVAQATVGINPNTGKPKRKTFYGQTRKEAIEKMNLILHDIQTNNYFEATNLTLDVWLTRWLNDYKKPNLKQTTFEGYEITARTQIIPSLGKVKLIKLQAADLQRFYNEKLQKGRVRNGTALSPSYIRHMHIIINGALKQAVKENLLSRNVADATSPPRIKSSEMKILTEQQLKDFMSTIRNDRLAAALVLDISTGLRRGELLGLTWNCIDFENKMITVKRQLLAVKKGSKFEESTKSKAGMRSIPIPENVIRELRAHKARQAKEKLLLGDAYNDNQLVFCRVDGTPVDPRYFSKLFQRLLEKANLPKVRLHDLRHSHASLLLALEIHPKIVQERLGHSSITVTLDKYSHLVPGLQQAAANKINDMFDIEKNDPFPKGQVK